MNRLSLMSLACALAVAWPKIAAAQYLPPENERGVAFEFAGGTAFPLGAAEDRFNPGAGFLIGVGFDFSKRLSLIAEYALTWHDVKSSLLPSADIDGDGLVQVGDLALLVNVVNTSSAGLYLLGAPGLYFRQVEITRFVGTGVSTFCDPWLLICYPTAVPVEDVLGSASATDFGVQGGIGGFLRLGPYVKLYLEARYHYIWGDEIDTASGPRDTDTQYIPIYFGIRI